LGTRVRSATTRSRIHMHTNNTTRRPAHRSLRHGARRAHGTVARRRVALGSSIPKAKRSRVHRLTRHGGKGSLQCEFMTWIAWFDTRSWGNGGELALGGSMARS
jgi:hypothetical protein